MGERLNKTVIMAHIDCDGILSSRLAQKVLLSGSYNPKHEIIFQKWYKFGIDEEDIKLIMQKDPASVYVLDLGADESTLTNLSTLAELDIPVTVIDNHPPKDKTLIPKFVRDNFTIDSRNTNCTTGILYEKYKEDLDEWGDIWAALAIYGDVANESEEGKPMLDEILNAHPLLAGDALSWSKGEEGKFGTKAYGILGLLSGYFNTPRRIARHYGAYTGLRMAQEVEQSGDLTLLLRDLSISEQALYPATHLVKQWKDEFSRTWTDVFKADNIRFWDMGKFTVSVINHQWNIASQVANIKKGEKFKVGDTYVAKPHFCINTLPADGYITIGARRPDDSDMDLGAVLESIEVATNGRITGGGLPMAASGHAPVGTNIYEIINLLIQSID